MDPDAIQQLAHAAACAVHARFAPDWTPQDWEDARQAGALGIVSALRRASTTQRGYLFGAARREITLWMFRQWRGRASLRAQPLGAWADADDAQPIEPPARGWTGFPLDRYAEAVRALLATTTRAPDARGGPGQRRAAIVERDMYILARLSDGWTHQMIADELGIPKNHVDKYRQAIRRRLSAAQEE